MNRTFSFFITSTFSFILGIIAILAISIASPGMAQAVLGTAVAQPSPGAIGPGISTMSSDIKSQQVNPGGLADTGIYGTVGIGTASPLSPLHISSTTSTQPETIDLSGVGPMTAQWNNYYNGSSAGSGFLARFARGTKGAEADVQVGDRLGFNVFGGWAGGAFRHTAGITAGVDTGTVSATSLPTYLAFTTTPNGSVSRSERMRIDSAGRVGIGTITPDSLSQLTVYRANGTSIYGNNTNGSGVTGSSTGSGTGTNGYSASGTGVYGKNTDSNTEGFLGTSTYGVRGTHPGSGSGVRGESNSGNGVYGSSSLTGVGVYGKHMVAENYGELGNSTAGVYGYGHLLDIGVKGFSDDAEAVYGENGHTGNIGQLASNYEGVHGISDAGTGVYGETDTGYAIYGISYATGYAGYFGGPVYVSGTLSGPDKDFKIDHPQDPENKYLIHSVIESPDRKNVYDGIILLNGMGEATIELPSYFEALNRDFRYQLTAVGAPGPNLYIASEIAGNRFRIAGGSAGMKVSWMVTGIRQDAYATAHPIVVEQEKPASEKGYYLNPEEWGQPESKGINAKRMPETSK